jgi:ribonuclease-3
MREDIAKLFGLGPNSDRLVEALTHPSYRNERATGRDNQRLEFLGDAVLGFCVTDLLCERFGDADEGRLTRMRARLVNARNLAAWARRNRLAEGLLLGRGATAGGLHNSTNVLADAVEALIAAAYLEQGLAAARRVCAKIVADELARLEAGVGRDPKSELQERLQALGREPPAYQVERTGGPPHDRWFVVSVRLQGASVAQGEGRSKRTAEQAAAQAALETGAWQAGAAGPNGEDPETHR